MSLFDEFSDADLVKLKDWLEPWFQSRASSGIREITSRDKTVRVRRPFGPVVDLHVTTSGGSGWQFNTENGTDGGPSGWGQVVATDSHDGGWGEAGLVFVDETGESAQLRSQDPGNTKQGSVYVDPDTILLSFGPGGGAIAVHRASGNVNVFLGSGGQLNVSGLPTTNPGGTGNVWNDSGTLKIT